ncbi:hypothetical protein NAEGRDRAFT_57217 [Naegleria gruberi]|uniref:Carbohydrate kinase PfkB domain-containing protein n=1 Tax=Naegleria gruberi TaxID=5762 RepID=D2V5R4_NAEGR|nr:uncharacterized protein NAEGRDRAFT_57217 [Naegleria gruberi]EFC47844.1 hypothetical protein NAEGRDRAFT_57217 [Naegleria gruberi]|eukprot:XP_002680588.1 hypothetical protein NAEGRDRAFT_57217 [Naegleria gruberi strain NEG-M]
MMLNEKQVIFVGNITQDTIITFEKDHHQHTPNGISSSQHHHIEQELNSDEDANSIHYQGYRKIVNKSLGGSVMFGCLAFQHYMKNIDNQMYYSNNQHFKIHPKILTKIGKHDVMILSQFFNGLEHAANEDDSITMVACESPIINKQFHKTFQPDLSEAKHLKRMKMFDMILVEEDQSSKLTQYELLYPPFDSLENASNSRSLNCRDRGSIFKQDESINLMIRELHQVRALLFVPVAAEFDHHFVNAFTNQVFKEIQSDFLVCTDIQGYLRKIDTESGQVSHNTIEYLEEVLETLSKIISVIKLDHDEAKKCIPNSSEMTPEECAYHIQKNYGFPIVTVTMGSSGCVCACEGENIQLSLPRLRSNSSTPIVKYFSSYKPVRVLDETGAGDTFLSCFVAELLVRNSTANTSNKLSFSSEQVFESVKLACSATSFRVEQRGLNGFSTRIQAQQRVNQQTVNM